jgi:hypothetical protein
MILNKKTGFKVTDPSKPVIIRDERGRMFYNTEPIIPRCIAFNMPEGTYIKEAGAIQQMISPVNYPLVKLPKVQRNYPSPFKFKLIAANNPNKCSIIWNEKKIIIDYSLLDKSLFVLHFILFHEYGHQKYTDEKLADLYAANCMLKKGYNPSQIGMAPILSLSNRQMHRKEFIIDQLTKGV